MNTKSVVFTKAPLVPLVLALIRLVGCEGLGLDMAGCSAPLSAPFPEEALIDRAVQIRVGQEGLAFIEENAIDILTDQLEGGLSFCIPAMTGEWDIIFGISLAYGVCDTTPCSTGEMGCQADLTIEEVHLQAVEPSGIQGEIVISHIDEELDVWTDYFIGSSACHVRLQSSAIPISTTMNLTVDPVTGALSVDMASLDMDLGDLELEITGDLLCDFLDLVLSVDFLRDMIVDGLAGPINDAVSDLLDTYLCQTCLDQPCPQGTCDEGGLCRLEDGACLPWSLAVEGELALSTLLAPYLPPGTGTLQYRVVPITGLEVLNGGFTATSRAGVHGLATGCVKETAPQASPVALLPEMTGNLTPAGEPFHVAAAISRATVEQALVAAYQSGLLCLQAGPELLGGLKSDTLAFLLPSLNDLTDGEPALLAVRLLASEAPEATIGTGQVEVDPTTGQATLVDPLISLAVAGLSLDLMIEVEGRFVRLFTMTMDLSLGLGVDVTAQGEILPVLGDLGQAIQNAAISNAELLSEDPSAIVALLPFAMGLAKPLLADLLVPVAIPELMGFQIHVPPGGITSSADREALVVYGTLTYEGLQGLAALPDTHARIVESFVPDPQDLPGLRPWVRVEVGGVSPGGLPLEYRYRVDDGPWSLHTPSASLIINDASLLSEGEHRIELTSRIVGSARAVDPTPAEVSFSVDLRPPRVELRRQGMFVTVLASDGVTAPEDIALFASFDGGPWEAMEGTVVEGEGHGGAWLDIRAVDEAGREAVTRLRLPLTPGECSMAEGVGSGGIFLVLLALLGLRRRRRDTLLVAMVMALGACGDDGQGGCQEDQDCPAGQICLQGNCVTANDSCGDCAPGTICRDGICVAGCLTDGDCGPGLYCTSGECGPLACTAAEQCSGLSCALGAAGCVGGLCQCPLGCDICGPNQACCMGKGECVDLPDPCAATSCPDGQVPAGAQGPITIDPWTCEAGGGSGCLCVSDEPLPMGDLGRFSSIGAGGGMVWAAAYSATYGDLLLGQVREDGVDWEFVAGVPLDGVPDHGPTGPRGGVSEVGSDVGTHTALAVSAAGVPHVAYRNEDLGRLMYGRRDLAGFMTHPVDMEGETGRYASMILDGAGRPVIAYLYQDGAGGTALRVAWGLVAAPMSEADWDIVEVDRAPAPVNRCGGPCPGGQVCLLMGLVCVTPSADGECGGPCGEGQVCVGGSCLLSGEALPQHPLWPLGTGLFTDMALLPDGAVQVVYYDSLRGNLMAARVRDQVVEGPEVVLGEEDGVDGGDVGAFATVTVDEAGHARAACFDVTGGGLVEVDLTSGAMEVVDSGQRTDDQGEVTSLSLVGADGAMGVDGQGLYIAYQDSTELDLMLARRDGSGAWSREAVTGGQGSCGFYGGAALSSGLVLLTYCIDMQADPIFRGVVVVHP